MKKGNWIPSGVGCEVADFGGFYVNIFDGIGSEEWGAMDRAIDELKETVVSSLIDMYPSFTQVKRWEHDGVVILENNLAQIVIGDNESSMAVYVVIPNNKQFQYSDLGKKRIKSYMAGLQMILLKYYPGQVRYRTGPWTSGVLRAAM